MVVVVGAICTHSHNKFTVTGSILRDRVAHFAPLFSLLPPQCIITKLVVRNAKWHLPKKKKKRNAKWYKPGVKPNALCLPACAFLEPYLMTYSLAFMIFIAWHVPLIRLITSLYASYMFFFFFWVSIVMFCGCGKGIL